MGQVGWIDALDSSQTVPLCSIFTLPSNSLELSSVFVTKMPFGLRKVNITVLDLSTS